MVPWSIATALILVGLGVSDGHCFFGKPELVRALGDYLAERPVIKGLIDCSANATSNGVPGAVIEPGKVTYRCISGTKGFRTHTLLEGAELEKSPFAVVTLPTPAVRNLLLYLPRVRAGSATLEDLQRDGAVFSEEQILKAVGAARDVYYRASEKELAKEQAKLIAAFKDRTGAGRTPYAGKDRIEALAGVFLGKGLSWADTLRCHAVVFAEKLSCLLSDPYGVGGAWETILGPEELNDSPFAIMPMLLMSDGYVSGMTPTPQLAHLLVFKPNVRAGAASLAELKRDGALFDGDGRDYGTHSEEIETAVRLARERHRERERRAAIETQRSVIGELQRRLGRLFD